MNRYLCFVISALTVIFPSVIFASTGSEIIELQNAMGNIRFYHQRHQERINDCSVCHADKPGKIQGLGIEWGHGICKNCHFKVRNGLIDCIDCHQRNG